MTNIHPASPIFLKLSEGIFMFGNGAITRMEPIDKRALRDETPYNTALYNNTTKITVVKETLEQIEHLLLDVVRKG